MISLCDRSYKIAKNMDNFSAWIREELLKYDPEHQRIERTKHLKHAWECIPCGKISWMKNRYESNMCRHCAKPMIYMGHLDRREYQ
jgi:succinate dehydrogenase/fumarate reductase-like Fe-S protein